MTRQLLICAATIAILALPGVAMFLAYPRAPTAVPVIYITPQSLDAGAPLSPCTLRAV